MLQIIDKCECTGCHACYNVCPTGSIAMSTDDEGFWYPQIDLATCVDCDQCLKFCPIVHTVSIDNNPIAYAAFHKVDDIRMQSSSGGVFTAFAENVLCKGGVVFGACFDKSFNVVHDYIESVEDIYRLRGSKYVQSKIGDAYKLVRNFINQKRLVLFTGTPCQLSGLKSYLWADSEYLVTQDIICHGVPSPKVWQKYLDQFTLKDNIQSVSFRNKDMGWARFSMKVATIGKQYRRDLTSDNFLKAFLSDLCLRPSCHHCKFKGLNRESDVTLADFWGVELILPDMNDNKGISLVLINSEKGHKLFNNVNNALICKPVDILEATKYNKAATQSIPLPEKRQYFFEHLNELPFDSLVEKCTKEKNITKFRRLVHKIGSKTKKILFHSTTKRCSRRYKC